MKTVVQTWIVFCVVALASSAGAAEQAEQRASAYPPVPLADILESVSQQTGRVFLTDHRVPAEVVVGQLKVKDISYAYLLIILFNNGLAAVHVDDIVNIVPAPIIRTYALPTVHEDDDSIAEYEWVSRIVEVKNGPATQYVPILRPMLPQMAHLVADSASNSILIAGRYGNTKRLVAIIKEMDKRTTPRD